MQFITKLIRCILVVAMLTAFAGCKKTQEPEAPPAGPNTAPQASMPAAPEGNMPAQPPAAPEGNAPVE